MSMQIVILEDNPERQSAMQTCLADRFHQFEILFFEEPRALIDHLEDKRQEAILISLDHDIDLQEDTSSGVLRDPGTGLEVAQYLATKPPICPVVVHTSNRLAEEAMRRVLRKAGWTVYQVTPFDDLAWISTSWFRTVRDAIVAAAKPREALPSATVPGAP